MKETATIDAGMSGAYDGAAGRPDLRGRILDCVPFALILLGEALRIEHWNPAAERIFQWTAAEALARAPWDLLARPGQAEQMRGQFRRALQGEAFSVTLGNRQRGGGLISCDWHLVQLGASTAPNILCTVEDVSGQAQLEERLRNAQRMEATARLAGGIAHDFNNLLTVINCNSELILAGEQEKESLGSCIREIKRAGERAAALTRQLLILSQRPIARPGLLDINQQLMRLEKTLRRILGEDIILEKRLAPDSGCVLMDPGELEQVLLNLAMNARDAMPAGGILRIETQSVQAEDPALRPGRQVLLAISDTGAGMDGQDKTRLFLSAVDGIVKRAGGSIAVAGLPDEGARLQILLPRVEVLPGREPAAAETTRPAGRQEAILLVEDDASIRSIIRQILEKHGYSVHEAASGMEALKALEKLELAEIQLLLTDMVMPKMTGKALADRLQARNPRLKVLFMSGYVDQGSGHQQSHGDRVALMQKPFSMRELAYRVRELLDR